VGHGISDADLVDAPTLARVWPRLLQITAGRTVLAYNASFDQDVVLRHAHRDGLNPAHLADPCRWSCLMSRRSQWLMRRRWLPLGGGHRARGDCEVALDLLTTMTAPARPPHRHGGGHRPSRVVPA
jgi:DNA polymerase III epsilon subunit-like protein